MENNTEFNLKEKTHNWKKALSNNPSVTEADVDELESHLLDLIDDLKAKDLDDEEAFWVAKKRLGSSQEWEEDYQKANNAVLQIKKSLIILAGILIYFLSFYFLKFSSKLLLISLLALKIDSHTSIKIVLSYLTGAHLFYLLFASSIYFREKKTVAFIERIKMEPRDILYLLITTIGFGIIDTCLLPISKKLIRASGPIGNQFYDINFYFNYSFPLIICLSFFFLHMKYFKQTKSTIERGSK